MKEITFLMYWFSVTRQLLCRFPGNIHLYRIILSRCEIIDEKNIYFIIGMLELDFFFSFLLVIVNIVVPITSGPSAWEASGMRPIYPGSKWGGSILFLQFNK